tara:strand:+ start:61 stop:405 length:345 start_codon:yes stop_codon:yes gene_type:complete
MAKSIISICIAAILFLYSFQVNAEDIDQKNLDKLVVKVSKKFSRTYCNTYKFGISNEGAIEFALGETNKEFSNNKLFKYISKNDLSPKIISNIETECQVYDFPEVDLTQLDIKK